MWELLWHTMWKGTWFVSLLVLYKSSSLDKRLFDLHRLQTETIFVKIWCSLSLFLSFFILMLISILLLLNIVSKRRLQVNHGYKQSYGRSNYSTWRLCSQGFYFFYNSWYINGLCFSSVIFYNIFIHYFISVRLDNYLLL